MSAEEETTGSAPREEAEQEPAGTPAAGEKRAAKKAAAEKKVTAEKKPAAEKKAGKKPAKKAAAKKAPAKKTSEPVAGEKAAVTKPSVEKPSSAKAKPARGGQAAKPPRRKVVRAHARYVRTSARKARMVCGHLRGKTVGEARAILAFTPREVARDWSKLLESAVANAESNHELLEDDLIVREAYADEGPTIKRFRPRAMGRATPIRKRTSHLTITLTPGPERGTTKRHG
jgi:ribosomal protein L22